MVLILLSKHTRKDFQVITYFGCSVFITSQALFVPTNMVLKRYLACQTSSNVSQTTMRAELFIHTYIHLQNRYWQSAAQLCLCSAVYQDGGIITTLAKSRPVTRGTQGASLPRKVFSPPGKMCWTLFETIGHSSKNLGPLRKPFATPAWCLKLFTGLAKSLQRRTIELQLFWWLYIVM